MSQSMVHHEWYVFLKHGHLFHSRMFPVFSIIIEVFSEAFKLCDFSAFLLLLFKI